MPSSEPMSKKLKRLREARNLTIKETAKLIGVPESTYREWEYGRAIRGEPYLKISRTFNITLDELFGVPKISHDALSLEVDKLIEEMTKIKAKLISLKSKRLS